MNGLLAGRLAGLFWVICTICTFRGVKRTIRDGFAVKMFRSEIFAVLCGGRAVDGRCII